MQKNSLLLFAKIIEYQISSGFLCQHKQVISVLNFALIIVAVDEKITITFGDTFWRTLYMHIQHYAVNSKLTEK